MTSSLILFATLTIILITVGLLKFLPMIYRQLTYWKRTGVPYLHSCPVFGSAWRVLFRRTSFVDYITFVYNRYPDARYVGVMDFATPTVVVRDPDLIRTIAVKYFDHFPGHRSFVTEEMDPIFGKNVFSLHGDRWREIRNTLSPSFTANKMKFMFDLVSRCGNDFIDYLYDHPDFSSTIETKDAFTRYANDVIATVAFGLEVNSLKDRSNEFYTRGVDATNFSGVLRLMKFMLFRFSPRLMRLAGVKFLSSLTSAFFCRTITDTVTARYEKGIVRPDMIHLLMRAKDEGKHRIAIDDIVAQAFIFFLAGFDTVSTLMCYVTYMLALHRDVQTRLRGEVDRCLAEENDGRLSYETLSSMKYLDMVISETLRLHPPSIVTDRVCAREFELPPAKDGCERLIVRPGDNVWFPIFGIHRDPKYFPEPDKFDPERFSDENKDRVHPYAYIPFGAGPRQCIGNRFALMETKILVVCLLRKFVIKPNERTALPVVYDKGSFVTIPKDGLWISLVKREEARACS